MKNQCWYQLDINGDGFIDSLFILRANPKSIVDKKCVQLNAWNNHESFKPDTQIVLGFKISNDNYKKYISCIVFNSSFFNSPIYQQKELPINIVVGNEAKKIVGDNCGKRPNGDAVILGTEAGIDVYLYWAGEKFTLCEPAEEP